MTHYEIQYIKKALTQERIEAPDLSQVNGSRDVIISLYEAHRKGGSRAAGLAWQTIKTLRPDIAHYEQWERNWLYANELKSLTVPDYAHTDYPIYEASLNALVGPSGAGKSFVALDIAAKIATSERIAGKNVLYVAAEGLYGYSGRWEAWKQHYRRDSDNLVFYKKAINLISKDETHKFIHEIRDEISPEGLHFVIVDTVARCMVGGDENSTQDMSTFIDHCDTLIRELGCGVLVVHHTGKDGRMRGSSALFGACDSVLFLSRNDAQITVANSLDQGGKNKHQQEQPNKYFNLLPVEVEIQDELYESAVLIPADRMVQQTGDKVSNTQRLILETIEGYQKGLTAKAIQEATNIAQATVYRQLKNLLKIQYVGFEDPNYLITDAGLVALNQ